MTDAKQVREIFDQASKLDPDQRDAFLRAQCGKDAETRRQVELLLVALDQPIALLRRLDRDASSTRDIEQSELLKPPCDGVIDRYRLISPLGEGGMGTVWEAEQTVPVHRRLALKLLKPEMNTPGVIRRFEAERQALSIMDHPGIARVYDAGTTTDGRPWFVMELVNGVPITDWCDAHRLRAQARLELFIEVCTAVQHAHQKGIIHRDLKPSNVLVADVNGRPLPKVIDFGVAKAIGNVLPNLSMHTGFGQIVGTLEYMSPEQAGPDARDIDTRTDIYALGVMLYELLTGSTPVDRKQLGEAAFAEVIRIIREVEPQKPSTRISSVDAAPSVAANRNTEPGRLSSFVRGDLDWIAMKALEKDRSRRYQSAHELAEDLQRFLRNEPVLAGPPSRLYRFRKFLRRNRAIAFATSVGALGLLVGAIISTMGWVEASRQSTAAQNAETLEREARLLAESRLRNVEAGIEILSGVFDDLNPEDSDDSGQPARTVSDGELRGALVGRLVDAADRISEESVGDALAAARLHYRLGMALSNLGESKAALPVLERAGSVFSQALGNEDREALNCQDRCAVCLQELGRIDESLKLLESVVMTKRRVLGESDTDTLASWSNQAILLGELGRFDEAVVEYRKLVSVHTSQSGADSPDTLSAINSLAASLMRVGKASEAEPLLMDVLEKRRRVCGPEHLDTLGSVDALAACLRSLGKSNQVLPLLEESYQATLKTLGPDHRQTLRRMSNLAIALQDARDLPRAAELLEKTLQWRRTNLGSKHPDTLQCMSNLGIICRRMKRYDEAIKILEESLNGRREVLGPEHPDTLTSLNNLAVAWNDRGEPERSLPLLEDAVAVRRRVLGSDHPNTLESMNNLASTLADLGRFEQAESMYREVVAGRELKLGNDHPLTLGTMLSFGQMYRKWGRAEIGIPILEVVLDRGSARTDGLPPSLQRLPEAMCEIYRDAGRYGDSERQARTLLDENIQKSGRQSADSIRLMAVLGRTLLDQEKLEEAESLIRECLAIRLEQEPDAWTTFHTESLLGAILARKKSFSEAERLLLDGLSGMELRVTRMPDEHRIRRIEENRRWLAEMYRASDRPDDAARFEIVR